MVEASAMRSRTKVRLQDVADSARVSLFSASKVLNGNWREARITDGCAERIRAAALRLGYTPSYHAQSLSKGRSQTIGLVLREPRFNDPDYAAALMAGIGSQLASREHDLLILGRRGAGTELEHGLECLRQRRVDALVVPGCLGETIWSEEFEAAEGAIVLAVRKPGSVHPAVDVDPVPGIEAAVGHLHALGHREILWFTPDAKSRGEVVAARSAAFQAATAGFRVRGIEAVYPTPGHLRDGGEWSELARAHFSRLLDDRRTFTAAMCFNDATAIGACLAAHDLELPVPRDLSIVGFDDFHARTAVPPLTTISHELSAIGSRAAELAIAIAGDARLQRRLRGQVETIPTRLVVRDSTAPPAATRTAKAR
jgi:LacI family transcriptional regulator